MSVSQSETRMKTMCSKGKKTSQALVAALYFKTHYEAPDNDAAEGKL